MYEGLYIDAIVEWHVKFKLTFKSFVDLHVISKERKNVPISAFSLYCIMCLNNTFKLIKKFKCYNVHKLHIKPETVGINCAFSVNLQNSDEHGRHDACN